jgi:hypothetical protein
LRSAGLARREGVEGEDFFNRGWTRIDANGYWGSETVVSLCGLIRVHLRSFAVCLLCVLIRRYEVSRSS